MNSEKVTDRMISLSSHMPMTRVKSLTRYMKGLKDLKAIYFVPEYNTLCLLLSMEDKHFIVELIVNKGDLALGVVWSGAFKSYRVDAFISRATLPHLFNILSGVNNGTAKLPPYWHQSRES